MLFHVYPTCPSAGDPVVVAVPAVRVVRVTLHLPPRRTEGDTMAPHL